MLTLKRSHTLFLSSANRSSGQPHDFTVDLDSQIRRDDTEVMYLAPVYLSCQRAWDLIDEDNRHLWVRRTTPQPDGSTEGTDTRCSLPIGSGYNVLNLRYALAQAFAAENINMQVRYDPISNRYTFEAPVDNSTYVVEFPSPSLAIYLGWPGLDRTTEFTHANPVTSPSSVRLTPQTSLVVRTDIASETAGILDNFKSPEVMLSNALLIVSIDVPWFDEITWQSEQVASHAFGLRVAGNSINNLRIWIEDEYSRPILVPDYVIGLRLDVYGPAKTPESSMVSGDSVLTAEQ